MDYQTGVTQGGWAVSVAPMQHVESVCVGLWFPVGSRYESNRLAGASHFVEHMLFKGSKRRSAKEISQAVEGIGGYLNAFTAEEMTSYYASSTVQHLPMLLDVLLDMVYESTFPPQEVERERGVILEEIKMYEDQPAQLAQDGLNMLLWPDQPLGRPITGSQESVGRMKREDLIGYGARYYTPGRMQIVVAGKTSLDEVKHILGKNKGVRPASHRRSAVVGRSKQPRQQAQVRLRVRQKPIEQTHLALGLRGVSRHDPRRYAIKLASVILGENMSSRLFQKIREQHGLAYSIGSSVSYFTDTGALVISAGVANAQAIKATRMILKVIQELALRAPSASELRRAQDYVIGQMWMGLESTTNQNMWMGEALLGYGQIYSPHEMASRLRKVTREEIREAMVFLARNDKLCLSVVSPEAKSKEWEKVARFA
jgi:predicted Zn-dependent peptidase